MRHVEKLATEFAQSGGLELLANELLCFEVDVAYFGAKRVLPPLAFHAKAEEFATVESFVSVLLFFSCPPFVSPDTYLDSMLKAADHFMASRMAACVAVPKDSALLVASSCPPSWNDVANTCPRCLRQSSRLHVMTRDIYGPNFAEN